MLKCLQMFNFLQKSHQKIQVRHFKKLLDIHPAVQNALNEGLPIVALESTIITHGMPYPHNINTAIEVEKLVSMHNAVPATIAVINGRLKIGLYNEELEILANTESSKVYKCSRRDLPCAIAMGGNWGTTVSATMIAAHMAGISVFATGGIGGVHRNGHNTMDVSADLTELGKTPITVISSGIKSILDIPRTLEYLETQGVCVATYDSNDAIFPDFYTRDSGCKVNYNLKGPKEAARLINALKELQMSSGVLIGVPIPKEYAIDKIVLNQAIDAAIKQAEVNGIQGKEVTPYLLSAIAKLTHGNSLHSNIALIKNNASIAAQIAAELSQLNGIHVPIMPEKKKPLIVGACMLDLSSTLTVKDIPFALNGGTYCTHVKYSAGGVGRNLAEGICKLYGGETSFLSIIGNDYPGQQLLELMPNFLRKHIHITCDEATAICSIILDTQGDCKMCLANMQINDYLTPKLVEKHEQQFRDAPLIIMDANVNIATMETILMMANKYNKIVFYEPTDFLVATKPFQLNSKFTQSIRFISPNLYELKALAEYFTRTETSNITQTDFDMTNHTRSDILKTAQEYVNAIEQHFDCIIVTLGKHGALLSLNSSHHSIPLFNKHTGQFEKTFLQRKHNFMQQSHIQRYYEAPLVEKIVNVSGAGDSFTSGFIAGMLRGLTVNQCVALGFHAASKALQCVAAVPQTYFESTIEEADFINSLEL